MPDSQIASLIVRQRWYKRFPEIAAFLKITEDELETFRKKQPYIQAVKAEYKLSKVAFIKHSKREDCVNHIATFFGIPKKLADEILNDDKKPDNKIQKPKPEQCKLDLYPKKE